MHRLTLLVLITISVAAHSQTNYQRYQPENGWQAGFVIDHQASETIANNQDAQASFSSNTGWGFFVGYRFNQHLALDFDMTYNNPKYRATFTDANNTQRTVSHRSSIYSGDFNLIYHPFDGWKSSAGYPRLKPFVRGGIGWVDIDSNISDGGSYCVPDYYWGWYCYNSSYSSTDFSYNAGLGLTMDLSKTTYLRASYGRQWVDLGGSTSDAEFDRTRLEIGFKY